LWGGYVETSPISRLTPSVLGFLGVAGMVLLVLMCWLLMLVLAELQDLRPRGGPAECSPPGLHGRIRQWTEAGRHDCTRGSGDQCAEDGWA